ncbi:MAG: 50S ribosomal protein L25 [Ardenticatenaceae bacterium]|nr:50S ribosomal protein L25 [Anaerolineales bacterium]MCB9007416.1 50S ribosomal protein L25 [Ardenticatenaceae bacterium]
MSDDRLTIDAEPRAVVGKKVKQLRRTGMIPAVIYGINDPVTIQLENKLLRRVLRRAGTTNLIDISVAGDTRTVLAREIQQHLTRGDLIHVDFQEVDLKVKITAEASLVLVGRSKMMEDGLGSDVLSLTSVEIEALPDDLVAEIEVDVSQLQSADETISVGDLPVPDGVAILTDPETTIARFEYARLEEEETEEELEGFEATADSVEIIEKGKADEDEEE